TRQEIAVAPVKFTVHEHHMNVEVVGTALNVRTREQQSQVGLTGGKVRALDKGRDVLWLKCGDRAEFNDRKGKLTKRPVNDSAFSSWRGDKITFDNDRIGEIFLWLRETYGYNIEIDDKTLLHHRYTGSVPVNNVELLFDKIATLYHLEVRKEGKNIWFEKR